MMLLAVMDMISILVVTVFAIYIRYDFSFKDLPQHFLKSTIYFIPINLVVTLISLVVWNLYTSVWRYASATELINIVGAVVTATIGQVICKFIFKQNIVYCTLTDNFTFFCVVQFHLLKTRLNTQL